MEKSNGMATYNFAVVIDDYLMKISHVLRGDDHIANTPKQLAVYEALGIPQPLFGHITLIYSLETHKKLSKRDKNTLQFISQYRKFGYLNEALVNFIAFLGWSPIGEKELFTRDELIEAFDIHRMSASPAYFDQKKLDWINSEYIKKIPIAELANRIVTLINAAETDTALKLKELKMQENLDFIKKVIQLYRAEAKTLMTFMEKIYFIKNSDRHNFSYADLAEFDKNNVHKILLVMQKEIQNAVEPIDYDSILLAIQKETGQSGRNLYMPLNVVFTDNKSAPQITELLAIMPKKNVEIMIANALKSLNQ
ncbi:glutamate--tRNA ligase [Enterococcus faecalis]|uniref:glutamate--tRNA ligase n=1 Tax=Enterococcus TaxID=1350 RepID=UPI001E546D15